MTTAIRGTSALRAMRRRNVGPECTATSAKTVRPASHQNMSRASKDSVAPTLGKMKD